MSLIDASVAFCVYLSHHKPDIDLHPQFVDMKHYTLLQWLCSVLLAPTIHVIVATAAGEIDRIDFYGSSNVMLVTPSNGSQVHDNIGSDTSDSTTTIHPTSTVTKTLFSTTVLRKTTTDLAVPGRTLDCTFDINAFTEHRNSWTRCPGTVMIGRIHYIVDSVNNKTSTSTSYAAQVTFEADGSKVTSDVRDILANQSNIITRTDVNAAGTVTHVDNGHTVYVLIVAMWA